MAPPTPRKDRPGSLKFGAYLAPTRNYVFGRPGCRNSNPSNQHLHDAADFFLFVSTYCILLYLTGAAVDGERPYTLGQFPRIFTTNAELLGR